MNKTYGGLVSQPRNSRGTTVIGTGVTHTFSGEVVETIAIPEEYVVHDVIAPEGDVQVFKDQQCTEYATGAEQTVYVRLNTAVEFGEGWHVGTGDVQGSCFDVTAPSEGHEDDPYYVQVWALWDSDDFSEAFTEGQVVKCVKSNPDFDPVENPTTIFNKPEPPTPVGPTAIDLGLPSGTLWADRNVGATAPEEAGLYFAWGETEGYKDAADRNAKLTAETGTTYTGGFDKTSYNRPGGASGITGDLTSANDAATVNLGSSWRMPTKGEFQELINNTDRIWTTINDVSGYKFMRKDNNNIYIFIGACGMYDTNNHISTRMGFYDSSVLRGTHPNRLRIYSSNAEPDYDMSDRHLGCNIRAVQ